jgi:alpha-tubulin suppressor-like RCC1 family protein
MPFTKITSTNIAANTVASYAEFANFASALAPRVSYANVANSLYFTVDDTAVNVGGGYIVVTGANFQSGATVLIDTVQASAVTYVDSTTLRVQVPARSAATYNLYVVNPDGGTGIRVNGLTYSSEPTWVTASPLSNQASNTAFGVSLSATGATSYSVAAGSTLPAGTTLAANGLFSGTVSIGAQTTYSFSVVATDAENQDSSKTFQVTVTVIPPPFLYTWGKNNYGQLGTNDISNRSSPTQVGTSSNWSANVSSALESTLIIKTDGTLWAWGRNTTGVLGQNDTNHRSSPTQVGTGTDWSKLSDTVTGAGTEVVFAIKTNGTLWGWGNGTRWGNLGLGTTYNSRSSPTQIGALTNWSEVSCNGDTTLAVKNDGTLWSWGSNFYAALGQGVNGTSPSADHRSSPVQLASSTDWSKVFISHPSAGSVLAIKTNGTLWGWGRNYWGTLGKNTSGQSLPETVNNSPAQIGAGTNWLTCSMTSYAHVAALKTDGTLWLWGHNDTGQLGFNDINARSSPTQLGINTWTKIKSGIYHTTAVRSDGTIWSIGQNDTGQLGLNNTIYRSSPVQIGTESNWSSWSFR